MTKQFETTLVDPPWPESGGGGRGAQNHYPLIESPEEICRVIAFCPLWNPAPASFLWMWTTSNYRTWAEGIIQHLGFATVTDWVWLKRLHEKPLKRNPGLGQYRRSEHEHLMLAKRGEPQRCGQWPSSVFVQKPTEHSVKPEESYQCIEKVTPGPRLELFCRNARAGWASWGGAKKNGKLVTWSEDRTGEPVGAESQQAEAS